MKIVSFSPDLDLISQEKTIKRASQGQIDFLKLCSETLTWTHPMSPGRKTVRCWKKKKKEKKRTNNPRNSSHELGISVFAHAPAFAPARLTHSLLGSYCTVAPPRLRCRKKEQKVIVVFSFLPMVSRGLNRPPTQHSNLYAFP